MTIQRQLTILVVDDQYFSSQALGNFIRSKGQRAFTLNDGRDVMPWLQKNGCDVVILDLDLNSPDFNGLEVLKLIRSFPCFSRLPVCVFSGSSEDSLEARECWEAGCTSFISKATGDAGDLFVSLMDAVSAQAQF